MVLSYRKRGSISIDFSTGVAIAIVFGIVVLVGIILMKGNWSSITSYLRNIFRFGG